MTKEEEMILIRANFICKKYNCFVWIDFKNHQMEIDGEPELAEMALNEIIEILKEEGGKC